MFQVPVGNLDTVIRLIRGIENESGKQRVHILEPCF